MIFRVLFVHIMDSHLSTYLHVIDGWTASQPYALFAMIIAFAFAFLPQHLCIGCGLFVRLQLYTYITQNIVCGIADSFQEPGEFCRGILRSRPIIIYLPC